MLLMFNVAMSTLFLVRKARGEGVVMVLCSIVSVYVLIAWTNGQYPSWVRPDAALPFLGTVLSPSAEPTPRPELTAEDVATSYLHPLITEFSHPQATTEVTASDDTETHDKAVV